MTLSILHRLTGVVMSVGLIGFVIWLEAIAYDVVPFAPVDVMMRSVVGQWMLLGWLFSFFFHLASGVRHLVWDTGRMLEKNQAETSARVVLIAAVSMTAGYWFIV